MRAASALNTRTLFINLPVADETADRAESHVERYSG
jgi:hypothetical protein